MTRTLLCGQLAVCLTLPAISGCHSEPLPIGREGRAEGDADARRICASGPTLEGIDVSFYQGTIDWDAVAASDLAFGIARVSDGLGYPDSQFDRNWAEMGRVGLIRGAYQFFRPGQDPIAQAELVLDGIGRQLEPGDLPPVIDVETDNGVSGSQVVSDVTAWVDHVEAELGVAPIVYAASYFWGTLPDTERFADNPLWVANYGVSCPDVPEPWDDWAMWQYTDSGSVPGIAGPVDINAFNGTLAELEALASGAGTPDLAIEVYWARQADDSYDLRALAPPEVQSVEYRVDGWPIGSADRSDGHNFPDSYTFTQESDERLFEVLGYDADGVLAGRGVGLLDVTDGTAVYIKQMGEALYEIGLERAPADVAAIEVEVDDQWLLTDSVTGLSHSDRNAVRYTFGTLGTRDFEIRTYNADGSLRGHLYRTFTLE